MKILILSGGFPPTSNAGAEKVAFNLAKGLQESGNQVFVITVVQNKNEAGRFDYQGLTVFRIYTDYHQRWQNYLCLYNPQTVGQIKKIIKQIRPDVAHFHIPHCYISYYCFKIAKQYSRAVFLTAHDAMLFHYGKLSEFINHNNSSYGKFDYKINPWQQMKIFKKRYNPLRNIITRHYLKYVNKIFAVSYTLKDALSQNGIENVKVIHNGIDTNQWRLDNNTVINFKTKYGLSDRKVVLFAGRLSALKGGENIIRAMQVVKKKMPKTVLLVAGKENDYAREMTNLARAENVQMIFTGWINGDDLKSAYWSSDVVVTPSIYLDPFPTVNLEAMACKKPVVGTCFGGTPEIVVDNQTGYIVNPCQVEDLSSKILNLLTDSEKSKEFGKNGFQRIQNDFSIKKQVAEILKWYQKYV